MRRKYMLGPRLDIKAVFPGYDDSRVNDKTVDRKRDIQIVQSFL